MPPADTALLREPAAPGATPTGTAGSGTDDARVALMAGLVDDAALFPPERAPLDVAVRRHAAVRSSADAWLQGRFLVPASRVPQLAWTLGGALAEEPPDWPLAVVVDRLPAGTAGPDWEAALRSGLARLADEVAQGPDALSVDALEMPLPEGPEQQTLAAVVDAVDASGLVAGRPPLQVWAEVPLGGPDAPDDAALSDVRARVDALLDAAADLGLGEADASLLGVKVRCGGTTPGSVPHPARVAAVLATALGRGVPTKATAGLHHPHGGVDARTGDDAHGFLGVLGGAVLTAAGLLDEQGLASAVAERRPDRLRLDADGLHLRTPTGTVTGGAADLAHGRLLVPSYGSCSLAEPVAHLTVLGVLPL